MPAVKVNPVQRAKRDQEFIKCSRCEIEKDVCNFRSYWYQPTIRGVLDGEPVRRRTKCCSDCVRKRSKNKVE